MPPHLPDPSGPLAVALLATVLVTPVLSLLVLWRYRRAVGRSMRVTAQRRRAPAPGSPVPAGVAARPHVRARPAPVVVLDETHRAGSGTGPADDLWRHARRRLCTTVAVYTAAGFAFGVVVAAVWLTDANDEIGPRNLLALTVLFAWPLVPTLLAVTAAALPAQLLAWAGYVVLLLLATAGTGLTLAGTGVLVAILIGPAALVLVALGSRPVRTVGPFLAVPVLLTVAGLLLWPELVLWARQIGTSVLTSQLLGVVAAGLLGLVGFTHLAWTARQYARKRAGDQMLTISQWWFLAAALQSLLLIPSGLRPALAVWAAYLAFRVVLAVGMRLRPRPTGPPRRLLLLRTFGAPRRSEALLRRLSAHWRHVGPVSMIAGPDLAAAALEPHEFLDLLRGRLARRFVANAYELRRRVAELDDEPDPDGRYRVGELFCHDDMWRPAMQELLRRTDCVLLDARGFTRGPEGVAFEIAQVVQLVALDRVLVLVDDTTDRFFLRAVVDRARLDAVVPDAGGSLRLLRSPAGRLDAATVVAQLGRAGHAAT
jgi:hypothetical protein